MTPAEAFRHDGNQATRARLIAAALRDAGDIIGAILWAEHADTITNNHQEYPK